MTIASKLGKLALTAALGVALTGVTLTATSAPAEARRGFAAKSFGGGFHSFNRFNTINRFNNRRVVVIRGHGYGYGYGYGYNDCYYFKRTGQWLKYRACLANSY